MNRDIDIITKAVDAAPQTPGLSFGQFYQNDTGNKLQPDGTIDVTYNDHQITFSVAIKTHLHSAAINQLLAVKDSISPIQPLLIVTDQMAAQHSDMLIQAGVSFIDTAGNAFLDLPGLHLVVTGRRSKTAVRKPKPGRAFQPTGLKVVFAILTDPSLDKDPKDNLLNQPFRTIMQHTGVALGSIGWIINDLQSAGYIVADNKTRLLFDRKNLLQKWVSNYADRLRPKLLQQRYRMRQSDNLQFNIDFSGPDVLWGGEVAAARLTNFLRPQQATIYARGQIGDLILNNDLRPDPDGDVEILDMFWSDNLTSVDKNCVHPLLVYADLMASNVARNAETAQRIYDDHLRQIIKSD